MRYRLKKRASRYLVIDDRSGQTVGQHHSRTAAVDQLRALRTRAKAPTTVAGRAALDDGDFVLSQERKFPITSAQDVMAAVRSWGRYRGPVRFETFKRRLIELAQRKGFAAALPASWRATTKAYTGNGVMIAFYPAEKYQRVLAYRARQALGGAAEPAEDLHCTLAYLGKTDDPALDKARAVAALTSFAQGSDAGAIILALTGLGRFDTVESDGTNAVYADIDRTPGLLQFRADLVAHLQANGVPISTKYPQYTPHITLGYLPQAQPTPPVRVPRLRFPVGWLYLCWGSEKIVIPLQGTTTKPFRSQAQWGWAFATGQPWARRWARETPGGKGARYRKLPRKKVVAEKAPNYGARAGGVIQGNLVRGGDGKFTSAGSSSSAAPAKAKKPAKGKKPTTPKKTPDQRQQERAQQEAANRAKVYSSVGLAEDAVDSLERLRRGESVDDDGGLEAMGLAERGNDGQLRLTPAGRQVAGAAERGDVGMARDTLSRARDQEASQQERASARAQRATEREQRKQELLARRAAREAERKRKEEERAKKGGGGGGGGKKKDDKPTNAQAAADLEAQLQRLGQLVRASRGKTAGSVAIFKDARGQWRWITLTSNGYEDRDREIVATEALKADVARADADGKYGPLRWWHLGEPDARNLDAPWGPGVDIGWCDFNAMSGPFLVESGTFKDAHIAQSLAPVADQLGVSPGFFHPIGEPSPDGVFSHIQRFERSLAPRSAVSNPFTAFSITKEARRMDAAKLKDLSDRTGIALPELQRYITGAVETKQKEAQTAGVRFKTTEPTNPLQELIRAAIAAEVQATVKTLLGGVATEKALPENEDVAEADKAEDDVAADLEEAADDVADAAGDLLDMTRDDLKGLMVEALGEALTPLMSQMKMAEKMEGMLKSMGEEMKGYMGGVSKKTADQQSALDARVKTLSDELAQAQAHLAELRGEQPRAHQAAQGVRATETPSDPAALLSQFKAQQQQAQQPVSKAGETLGWLNNVINGNGQGEQPAPPAV